VHMCVSRADPCTILLPHAFLAATLFALVLLGVEGLVVERLPQR
jgi:hypothetical protein